ncbi:helix-turn-helix domain-containing protein [Adlercreutzia sp. ZJ138]|uniref:helix-turn-helix domain-containing protein n=1 Tax=Adlercreutzia sp. ZJ138 TaxID=2709405 RepID=UPI0013EAB950|nr:helix-turn-helix transcriptional regulator [Adlercreutzia sp. ZJ138]
MAKSIKDLRQEKGFRSAREFADALGIATSSMSRYDRDPESIPLKHAWAMADLLGCSIDEVVGRAHVTSGTSVLQDFYDGLLPETRALLDDFLEFARMKDADVRKRRKAQDDGKYERLCQFHERAFRQVLYDRADFGEVVEFDTPADERMAFMLFLRDQAAAKRKPGIDLHVEGLEEEMRGGYIDSDGTAKTWSEEEIESMLAEERAQMDAEYAKKDEEVIARVMEAYDRLHSRSSFLNGTTVEYYGVRLTE